MKRIKLLLLVIFFFLIVDLHAEKRLFLAVDEKMTYDSNIYLSTERVEDFIITTNPDIGLKLKGKTFSIDLFYGFLYFDYIEDSTLDYYAHIVRASGEAKLTKRFSLTSSYNYTLVPLEIGLPISSPRNLVTQSHFRTAGKYEREFTPRTTLSTGVEFGLVNYPKKEVDSDYWEIRIPLSITQKLDRLVTAGAGYTLLIRNFHAQKYMDYYLHHATLDGSLKLRKFEISSSFGYEWLDFNSDGVNSGPIVSIDIKYDITKRTNIKAGYSYSYTWDAAGNPFRGQRGELVLLHKFTERVDITPRMSFYLYKIPRENFIIRTFESSAEITFKPSRFVNFTIDYLYNYNKRNLYSDQIYIFDLHRAEFSLRIAI